MISQFFFSITGQSCNNGQLYNADTRMCYQRISETKTFEEAGRDCASRSQELVYVNSLNLNEWIADNFMNDVSHLRIWIGVSETLQDWYWTFGM